MNIQRVAYAEFHVEDARKSADQLVSGYGFRIEDGYRRPGFGGPGPGPDSVLLVHGGVRLVVTGAAGVPADHPVAEFVRRHGDGVAVIGVLCDDARAACADAISRGAHLVDSDALSIALFGDVTLRFVQPDDPVLADAVASVPAPSTPAPPQVEPPGGPFAAIDHVAVCVPSGRLAPTVEFCERTLGLRRIFSEYIEIGRQGMDSVVVQSGSGEVTFTLLEPAAGRRPGQIDAFLAAHEGAGVQHLALRTGDIARAVRAFGSRDVDFLTTPAEYYDALEARLGPTGIPLEALRGLNVLVDQDHGGQLFQIFASSVHPRRTYFFELIERRGAGTFGTANIRALYEAVERRRAAES
ncbi:MAG TPA: 4-hydroxyphenylpyruvate dioxygenase [Actinocrinis sp.]|jgi:4-hydroxymandelate synthase